MGPPAKDEQFDPLAADLLKALIDSGVPDAVMLRRVKRAREQLREIDDTLDALEKYFTAGPS